MAYDNTNTGCLFRNTTKFNSKSPDYSGTFNIDGHDVKVVGWDRTSKTGKIYISLTVHVPQANEAAKAA